MSEEKIEQILEEMLSLRRELSEIRQLLEQSHSTSDQAIGSLERAIEEYRRLPSDADDENAFRWGFIGAWGKGGRGGVQHAACSVQTTSMDAFLDSTPNEEIAAFAKVFTNPNAIEVCKYLFRNNGKVSKEALKQECNLNEETLAAALKPLLEWRFVEWKEEQLETVFQGVNFALTLIEMAKEGIKQKKNKWD